MPFGDKVTPEPVDAPLRKVRKTRWQKPDYSIKYGKNLAIVAQPMVGKTVLSLLFGYYNSKYKDEILKAGFPDVVKVMEAELLPEIETIMVLETENSLLGALNDGAEKKLLKPFVDEGRLLIESLDIQRKEEKVKDGKIVSQRREAIEEIKEEFDDIVNEVMREGDEHTLFIIDSMSAYKKLLDDKFGLMYEVISKRDNAQMEGVDTYKQAYYASRNTWWINLMKKKRGFRGWNIDTYQEKPIPEHYRKPGEDEYNIRWVGGTEHHLDMVFRIERFPDQTRELSILNGRYMPSNAEEHFFPYPLENKMGAMPLINAMAEKLLMGEE